MFYFIGWFSTNHSNDVEADGEIHFVFAYVCIGGREYVAYFAFIDGIFWSAVIGISSGFHLDDGYLFAVACYDVKFFFTAPPIRCMI